MANEVRKIAEVQETTWTQSSGKIIAGLVIFIVALAMIYFSQFIFHEPGVSYARIAFGLVAFGGVALATAAIYNGLKTRQMAGVGLECPYCDKVNKFEAEPTDSFDCEYCNRRVHFEDGVQVAVRAVNCPFCHTDHRVAVNVQRYVCDKCNRPLELAAQAPGARSPAAAPDAAATSYDVLMIAADRRHEIEIAMKLQNLLVVNLPEARRLMASASTTNPLIISYALPQRKAEAIRRQLQDVGATATIRPSEAVPKSRPTGKAN